MSCINNLHSNVSFAAQTPIYDQLEWSWAKLLHEFASASGRIWQRRRERQALLELDDRLLEDVGVTRGAGHTSSKQVVLAMISGTR